MLREDNTEADPGELGRVVIKLPFPPGTMSKFFVLILKLFVKYFCFSYMCEFNFKVHSGKMINFLRSSISKHIQDFMTLPTLDTKIVITM